MEPAENQRTDPQIVATDFLEAINAHDVDRLFSLMSEDHEFMDLTGSIQRGRLEMRASWESYFRMFPDYLIVVREIVASGNQVGLAATSSGSISDYGRQLLSGSGFTGDPDSLHGPYLWQATVVNDTISRWYLFRDTDENRELLGF